MWSYLFFLHFEVCYLLMTFCKILNKQHVLDKDILSENIIVVGSTGVYMSCSLLICRKTDCQLKINVIIEEYSLVECYTV